MKKSPYPYLIALCLCALIINENVVEWALAVKVGGYTIAGGLQRAFEYFTISGYLFLTALRSVPYAGLGFILLALSRTRFRNYVPPVFAGGLAGVLSITILGAWEVYSPLYTDEHMSSTAVIAFLFIPFYAAATGANGALMMAVLYTPFGYVFGKQEAEPAAEDNAGPLRGSDPRFWMLLFATALCVLLLPNPLCDKSRTPLGVLFSKYGQEKMEMKFTAVDGREVDLAKLRGKVVLVDFWATWCRPCVAGMPNVVAAFKMYHDKGFEVVGISLDEDKDKMLSFTRKQGMTWPQYFDGKGWGNSISSANHISSIPAMWLLDKKGKVRFTEARGEELSTLIEKLLAEQP